MFGVAFSSHLGDFFETSGGTGMHHSCKVIEALLAIAS